MPLTGLVIPPASAQRTEHDENAPTENDRQPNEAHIDQTVYESRVFAAAIIPFETASPAQVLVRNLHFIIDHGAWSAAGRL
jgi:hypothetical protein